MARLNVLPTRMELNRLKDRLKIATRGHRLLKDKQDELVRRFIKLVRLNNEIRQQVDQQLSHGLKAFALGKAMLPEAFVTDLVSVPSKELTVEIDIESFMSVSYPRIRANDEKNESQPTLSYGYLNSNIEIDESLLILKEAMDPMLKLAEIEKKCQLLGKEIERTRRRVNALEYHAIPQLNETIAFIEMKLIEEERSHLIRIMKVNDLTGSEST